MSNSTFNDIEIYLFDTTGVVHVPGALNPEEIERCRTELASLQEEPPPFPATRRWERLTRQSEWFYRLANDPRLLHRVRDVINQPLRLIESYGIHREAGSELLMHGGAAEMMDLPWGVATKDISISHSYKDGKLYCLYVKVLVYLDDVKTDQDGVFIWLIGSHKANFPLLRPWYMQEETSRTSVVDFPNYRRQPVQAGDLLIINESILHGTTRKTSAGPRRFAAFSYGPSFMSDWREIEPTATLDIHDSGYADSDIEDSVIRLSDTGE